jgi:hypothetical protein
MSPLSLSVFDMLRARRRVSLLARPLDLVALGVELLVAQPHRDHVYAPAERREHDQGEHEDKESSGFHAGFATPPGRAQTEARRDGKSVFGFARGAQLRGLSSHRRVSVYRDEHIAVRRAGRDLAELRLA